MDPFNDNNNDDDKLAGNSHHNSSINSSNERNSEEELRRISLSTAPSGGAVGGGVGDDADIPSELGTRNNTPLINFDEWVENAGGDPFVNVNGPEEGDDMGAGNAPDFFAAFNLNNINNNKGEYPEENVLGTIPPQRQRQQPMAAGLRSFSQPALPPRSHPDSLLSSNVQNPLPMVAAGGRMRSAEQHDAEEERPETPASVATQSSNSHNRSKFARRKKKPKGMPKRPLSAYNLFFQATKYRIQAERERSADENKKKNNDNTPRVGFEELGKIIGKLWRELSAKEKKVYEKLADKDGDRYRAEMEAYNYLKHKRYEEEANRPLELSAAAAAAAAPPASPMFVATAIDVSNPPLMSHSMFGHGHATASFHQHRNVVTIPSTSRQPQGHHGTLGSGFVAEPGASAPSATLSSKAMDGLQNSGPTAAHPSSAQSLRRTVTRGAPFSPTESHVSGQFGSPPVAPSLLGAGGDGAADPGDSNRFPLPPGMEIVLSDNHGVDRKYRVHYTCYSMTREAAHQYLQSLSGVPQPPPNNGAPINHHTSMLDTSPQHALQHTPTAPAPMQAVSQSSMPQHRYNGM